MSLTHTVDDAVEMARIRLGSDGNPWFVSPSGNNANSGHRPTEAFATLSKAMSVAQPRDKVFFDGQIDQTQNNILVYDLGLDIRQVIIPSGVSLFGANRATARILSDPLAGNSVTTVNGGSDVYMFGFWIKLLDDGLGFFSHPIGYNGHPSSNVIAEWIRVTADSDGGYHRSDLGEETGYWKYVRCSFETKYDAHTILGSNPNQTVEYEDCDLIVKGPSSVTPTTIGRAVTAQQGLTRLKRCRLITEALGAPTTIVSCCYARAGTGTVSRIELDDCIVRTRVPAGFVSGGGTERHLQTDAGCEIIASRVAHDRNKDVKGSGSIVYLNDAAPLIITPLLATTSNPRFASRDLPAILASSEPSDVWTIVSATGSAVDLSGKELRLVAYTVSDAGDEADPFDDVLAGSFKYESGGNGITLGGADNNQVTVQHSSSKTSTVGDYRYVLWNVTDKLPLARGKMPIVPALLNV
jgi:hypothetical protein